MHMSSMLNRPPPLTKKINSPWIYIIIFNILLWSMMIYPVYNGYISKMFVVFGYFKPIGNCLCPRIQHSRYQSHTRKKAVVRVTKIIPLYPFPWQLLTEFLLPPFLNNEGGTTSCDESSWICEVFTKLWHTLYQLTQAKFFIMQNTFASTVQVSKMCNHDGMGLRMKIM